jgi:hypothetical protein
VPTFKATIQFRFEAESIEKAGAELRRLQVAAREIGVTDVTGQVMLDEADADEGWTGYAPVVDPDG